jgi:glycosyltransferase involved in cell wall biosynthesis
MKTLLVVNTGNDIDIIEESLKHNEKFFTNILVADRQSYDGTVEVVKKLIKVCTKVSIINTIYEPENQWIWLLTILSKYKNNYDYIVFLDADEFIKAETLNEFQNIPDNQVGVLDWQCYVPITDTPKNFKDNIKYRRTLEQPANHKLVYPSKTNILPENGNHEARDMFGNLLEKFTLDTIKLAHFPVRSMAQYNKKIKYWTEAMEGKNPDWTAPNRNVPEVKTIEKLRYHAMHYYGEIEGQEVIYDPVK